MNTVNNDVNIYLKLGEKYIEPGFEVYSSTGKNINNQVEVIGEVNTNKKGKYRLVYSLENSDGTILAYIPVKAIHISIIHRDIEMTDEQRKAASERMKKIQAARKKKSEENK